jgi:hypothetical protein
VQTGEETRVGPPWLAGGGWVGITAPCPDGPFKVVAVDTSPTSWFAFRQPAEVAFGSAVAGSVVQRSRFVGLTAAALALLALVSTVREWRSRTVSPESTDPSLSVGVS